MLFVAIVKGVDSLTSFLILLSSVYRMATDFFELIFYPAILLKVFMSGRILRITYINYHIISKHWDLTSFPNCIPLISLWCLIALARTWRTILNQYGETGQPCLVPDFSIIANSFSPFSLMLAVGLVYIALIMFRYSFY